MENNKLKPHEITMVAAMSQVDPKTVRRYLLDKPVRALTRERIENALAKLAKKGERR